VSEELRGAARPTRQRIAEGGHTIVVATFEVFRVRRGVEKRLRMRSFTKLVICAGRYRWLSLLAVFETAEFEGPMPAALGTKARLQLLDSELLLRAAERLFSDAAFVGGTKEFPCGLRPVVKFFLQELDCFFECAVSFIAGQTAASGEEFAAGVRGFTGQATREVSTAGSRSVAGRRIGSTSHVCVGASPATLHFTCASARRHPRSPSGSSGSLEKSRTLRA